MSPVALLFAAAVVAGDPGSAAAPAPKSPKVALETSKGRIVLELDAARAPKSVENFLAYVRAGHYDGTIFHRVIPGFMVQGGGFDERFEKKPVQAPVQNEADNGLKNVRGTVAMARTGEPHSATAQFFVNVVDNGFLDHTRKDGQGWGYTVFGKVTEGMDVVQKIEKLGSRSGQPSKAIRMNKVTLIEA